VKTADDLTTIDRAHLSFTRGKGSAAVVTPIEIWIWEFDDVGHTLIYPDGRVV
jgi:hypothetical protein